MTMFRVFVLLGFCAALVPAPASSQERVGIVTAVTGLVMVARATDTPAEPLQFRDAIHLRDRVTTGDQAMTRILLGGRVVVTARERSALTLTEVPGASTIDVAAGRIAVTVDRAKLGAGALVEVRTPHAVTAVAGDTLIVEVRHDGSSFTVLSGRVEVFRLDPRTGAPLDPATTVVTRETVIVKDGGVSRPLPVDAAQARQLAAEFTPPVRAVAALDLAAVRDDLARALEALAAAAPAPPPSAPLSQAAVTSAPAPAAPGAAPTRPELRPGRHGAPLFVVFGGPGGGRGRPGDRDGGPGPRR